MKIMKNKFTKDIENVSSIMNLEEDNTDFTDPFNKEDRIWMNLYLIEQQLKTIKWVLIILLVVIVLKFIS